jgi:Lhr-like helicase
MSSAMCKRRRLVEKVFQEAYRVPGKPLQVNTVMLLAQCSNTFLLAGTGVGKTRIAEVSLKLFKKTCTQSCWF